MSDFDHIVIGAGISGLGSAHFSARHGLHTLVLEQSSRVGGCLNSCRFPGTGDFWVEAGSHTCFNSYGTLLDILGDLDLLGHLVEKQRLRYSLYREGIRKPVLSALHPLELAGSLTRLPFTRKQGRSVAEYYTAVLGRRNYRDLFSPAFSAVICQPAGDFPAELLFRRKPRNKRVVRSFTLPQGLEQIARAMAGQQGMEVKTGQTITAIHADDKRFVVQSTDAGEYTAARLTLAVPPDVAAQLLPDRFDNVAGLLRKIALSEIDSLSVCVPASALELPSLAGLIAVEEDFYSMVSRDYLAHPEYRGFSFHFRHGRLDAANRLQRGAAILGIGADRITGTHHTRNRLPALRTGHEDLVRHIDAALEHTGLGLTGNYFYGVSIEDCLTRSRYEFLRLIT
jgi:protoporphyrinogen oxidase